MGVRPKPVVPSAPIQRLPPNKITTMHFPGFCPGLSIDHGTGTRGREDGLANTFATATHARPSKRCLAYQQLYTLHLLCSAGDRKRKVHPEFICGIQPRRRPWHVVPLELWSICRP
jgi:hypothetical protein